MLPLSLISCGRPQASDKEEGFTLLELIVVMTLIGLMLSISIPSLREAFFTDPLKSTTRKVIGLVTAVRELAVRSQQPYLLHIDRLENRIWYEKEFVTAPDQQKSTQKEAEVKFPESVRISGIAAGSDIASSQDQAVIWISKQGYMEDTVIRIEDKQGNHLNVQFYAFLDPALVSDQVTSF
jgi:prepilin-type N-terminal cleavage/methylation domain-containing protein